MGMLILHLLLMFGTITTAATTKDNIIRILCIISSACWTLLFVGDIAELIFMVIT